MTCMEKGRSESSLSHVFRAYDVRGILKTELTSDFAQKLGSVFGSYLEQTGPILVSRDVRVGGEMLESSFAEGAAAVGRDILVLGQVPISAASFATLKGQFAAGVYITASHNPPEYNGFRFRHPDGTGYSTENDEIRDRYFTAADHIRVGRKGTIKNAPRVEILRKYGNLLTQELHKRRLRIAVDAGNGSASGIVTETLRKLGHDVIALYDEPDGRFPNRSPHNKDSEIGEVKRTVVERGCDFGVAFDGDGDRGVIIDEKGRSCQAEKIIVVLGKYGKVRRKRIVANISCSMLVEKELQPLGWEVHRCRVGDVFMSEAIKEHRASLGVEISSHFFMSDYYAFDDAILAFVKFAGVLSSLGKKVSTLMDEITSYPYEQIFVPCTDATKFQVTKTLGTQLKETGQQPSFMDGVWVGDDNGWILVRPSNTESYVKVSVEAVNEETLQAKRRAILTELETAMTKFGQKVSTIEAKMA